MDVHKATATSVAELFDALSVEDSNSPLEIIVAIRPRNQGDDDGGGGHTSHDWRTSQEFTDHVRCAVLLATASSRLVSMELRRCPRELEVVIAEALKRNTTLHTLSIDAGYPAVVISSVRY